MLRKGLLVALFLCIAVTSVSADDGYYERERTALHKAGRGLANGLFGWVEVPRQGYLTSKAYDPFTGLVYGSIKGVCYGVARHIAGAYELGTFVMPPYDKLLMEPEFVFEGWE